MVSKVWFDWNEGAEEKISNPSPKGHHDSQPNVVGHVDEHQKHSQRGLDDV